MFTFFIQILISDSFNSTIECHMNGEGYLSIWIDYFGTQTWTQINALSNHTRFQSSLHISSWYIQTLYQIFNQIQLLCLLHKI